MTDFAKLLSDWSKATASMDVTRNSEQLLNMMAGLKVPGPAANGLGPLRLSRL